MFRYIVLFFIVVPLLELYVLIKVGGLIGPAMTVFFVILTAIIGTFLLRQQGLQTLQRVQQSVAQGVMPAAALIEGLILLVSGVFLLAPGFVTDSLGFMGLIPQFRRGISTFILSKFQMHIVTAAEAQSTKRYGQHTIEGEYRRDQ